MFQCFFIIVATATILVNANPIANEQFGQFSRRHRRSVVREKRDTERNCETSPTKLPDTAFDSKKRLDELRIEMRNKQIQAYIIPSEDAHQSEYIADRDKRRQYISGFTGSAGLVIVTMDKALLWTDGRYFLQADQELDCHWTIQKSGQPDVPTSYDWLRDNMLQSSKIGYDATLLSVSTYNKYHEAISEVESDDLTMEPIDENLVDLIWDYRPDYPKDGLIVLEDKFTGEAWQAKLETLQVQLQELKVGALIVTKLDEIAWLFNLRGNDIPYNPMFISYAIVFDDDPAHLFLYNHTDRLTYEIKQHLSIADGNQCSGSLCVIVDDYDNFLGKVETLADDKIWVSESSASEAVYSRVEKDARYVEDSPILLMKAVKNPTEQQGMKDAHRRDSAAIIEFAAWLEKRVDDLNDPMVGTIEELSELSAQHVLYTYREKKEHFKGLSFETISGFGSNGAIIHYSSSENTNKPISKASTYLLDSGGQYLDGTTDITRTFHFGKPTDFQKEAYTRVLIGSIDLCRTVFRTGVYGRDIDAIARAPLWANGLDYRHGTGHGIGHFLNVHEGPARINIGYRESEKPIEVGMFFSDEPGYYEDGEFGIRLETIVMARDTTDELDHHFNNYQYMTFEPVALVPFEPILIDYDLLTRHQIDWLNKYNRKIRDELYDELDGTAAREWMEKKTVQVSYEYVFSNAHRGTPSQQILLSMIIVSLWISKLF